MNSSNTLENKTPVNSTNDFDRLSESNQMAVLNFMSLTNCEDTDLALRYLKKATFILDRALENYFSGQIPPEETKFDPNVTNTSNGMNQSQRTQGSDPFMGQGMNYNTGASSRPPQQQGSSPNSQNLVSQYRKHLEKRQI